MFTAEVFSVARMEREERRREKETERGGFSAILQHNLYEYSVCVCGYWYRFRVCCCCYTTPLLMVQTKVSTEDF